MKNKIFEIRKKMLKLDTSEDRLACLKNSFTGETVYIVAAGPSLNNHPPEKLKDFLSDKLTFSIKQSYDLLGDIADVHIQNFCNFKNYNYQTNERTISPWLVFDPSHPQTILSNNIKCDMMLPIYRNNGDMATTISEQGDYDSMLLESSFERPWGPGCMYELALPLAIYMGCKKIITIGWDIGNLKAYDDGTDHILDHFYEGESKIQYMPVAMSHKELTSVVNSTKGLYYWLKEKQIELEIISDSNPAYDGIPRIELLADIGENYEK